MFDVKNIDKVVAILANLTIANADRLRVLESPFSYLEVGCRSKTIHRHMYNGEKFHEFLVESITDYMDMKREELKSLGVDVNTTYGSYKGNSEEEE